MLLLYLSFILLQSSRTESYNSNLFLQTDTQLLTVISNSSTTEQFTVPANLPECSMPSLYIYGDKSHQNYQLISENLTVTKVFGQWEPITSSIECLSNNNCTVQINNNCVGSGKNQINWIVVEATETTAQYLVNCAPDLTYKPFEWGMVLLILFSTVIITISSLYSRAWSYGGIGYDITITFIILFNLLIVGGMVLAYFFTGIAALLMNVLGSVIGTAGAMVCFSESLWLIRWKPFQKKIVKIVRVIDLISFILGCLLTMTFWLTDGHWIINDILAVCSIIAFIKFLKLRKLYHGIILLSSLLLIEIFFGLFVHYFMEVSYNNLIISKFDSPILVTLPSITHELYRKCAWLPITALIFPGLFLSYLRRFDVSRSTYVYLLIGYVSFYIGSMLWMLIDLTTKHTLPFAIIQEPVTVLIVLVASHKRNEFKTLWNGYFHDQQMHQLTDDLLKSKSIQIVGSVSGLQTLTANLHIDQQRYTLE